MDSMITVLKALFTRDLKRLRKEIEAYQEESDMWIVDKEISNSGGNLCLHLIGNLNAFICASFGNSDYVRDREFEFAGKDVPRDELIAKIDSTITDVNFALDQIQPNQLEEDFPLHVFKEKTTTAYMLMHLATHLSYHLGQLNYHRRLLEFKS